MSMIKLITPGSWQFEQAQAQLIKMGRAGLRGNDLRALIKRAGNSIGSIMEKIALGKGEIPIHLIALGADEWYGPNRNGDAFDEQTCRDYHHTFVKHARWYRNHQNKDPKKSYGMVKYSYYNEDMHRIELIIALNGTKEAAERNGGLVADRELEKIASGKEDWAVSMACKVAYDVCSMCNNKARSRDEYCTADNCPGGGCFDNLCKVAEDGRITYVRNPRPKWFDMSDVVRPADRIAFVFGPLEKAASAGRVCGGAELAAMLKVSMPLHAVSAPNRTVERQMKLAGRLADLEGSLVQLNKNLQVHNIRLPIEDLLAHKKQANAVLKALAREKIALSLTDFLRFTTGCSEKRASAMATEIKPYLQGLFSRMITDPETLVNDLTDNPFNFGPVEPPTKMAQWAEKHASAGSLSMQHAQKRLWSHTINSIEIDSEGTTAGDKIEAATKLAKMYGLYKLAFLDEIADSDPDLPLTMELVIRQNHVS